MYYYACPPRVCPPLPSCVSSEERIRNRQTDFKARPASESLFDANGEREGERDGMMQGFLNSKHTLSLMIFD